MFNININTDFKKTAYQSISNEIDSGIFNVLVMNENKMIEIYNCIDWNEVIVTGDNEVFKAPIVYLKLLTAIVDHSDVVNIEKILDAYLNRQIDGIQVNNYLQALLSAIGASREFYQNSMLYICEIIREA